MIKSRVFISPNPEGKKLHVPVEHTCVRMCKKWVMCTTALFLAHPPCPLIPPTSLLFSRCHWLLPQTLSWYVLSPSLKPEVGPKHKHREPEITGLCMVSVYFLFIILSATASQPTVSDPQCTACTFIWWGGVVVYYSWVVRCEARVIWQK